MLRLLRPREYADAVGKSLPVVYKSIADGTLLSLKKSGERASVVADYEVELQIKAILADLNMAQRRELVQLLEEARLEVLEPDDVRARAIDFIRGRVQGNATSTQKEAA